MEYEKLAKIAVSRLLHHTSAEGFVHYGPAWAQYVGQEYLGYQNWDFLLPDKELITVGRLFRLYAG